MSEPTTKRCTTCGETKSLDAFYRDATKPDGFRGVCKSCTYSPTKPPLVITTDQFLRAWERVSGYACAGSNDITLDEAVQLARTSVQTCSPITTKERLKHRRVLERLDALIAEALELAKVIDAKNESAAFYQWHKHSKRHERYHEVNEAHPFLDTWDIKEVKSFESSYDVVYDHWTREEDADD